MAVCRVERTGDYTTMSNHHLRNKEISLKAKGLLSLMLSLPEEWDYTVLGLAYICKDGSDGVRSALRELEKAGYVERHRIRDGVGRFSTTEYIIREHPVIGSRAPPQRENPRVENPTLENPTLDNPTLENPTLGNPTQENPAQLITKELNTDKSITDLSITHSFSQAQSAEGVNGNDERNRVRKQIEYDCMVQRYSRQQLDELVEIMLEIALNKGKTIRIGKDQEYPREYVQERFSRINASHIEMVMEAIADNQVAVRSTKAYLMAVLFNSVSTIDHYYTLQANADFLGASYATKPEKDYTKGYEYEPGESL